MVYFLHNTEVCGTQAQAIADLRAATALHRPIMCITCFCSFDDIPFRTGKQRSPPMFPRNIILVYLFLFLCSIFSKRASTLLQTPAAMLD